MYKSLWWCLLSGAVIVGAVEPAAADVYSKELIVNGDFATELMGWSGKNIDASNNLSDQYAVSGTFLTLGQINETESASQTITIPEDAGETKLIFSYRFLASGDDADYLSIRVGDQIIIQTAREDAATTWSEMELDLADDRGTTVTVEFLLYNDDDDLSFADIDRVSIIANSYPQLTGIVKDSSGKRLRNAAVTIRNAKNKKVWEGKTNKKGKFVVTTLAGGKKSYHVIIKKDELSASAAVTLRWAKEKRKVFRLRKKNQS